MLQLNHLIGFGAVMAPASIPAVSYIAESETFSGSNPYTCTGISIGTAAADRYIAVSIFIRGNVTISSVTVGGVSATSIKDQAGGITARCAIFIAAVPTGTTADVVLTLSGAWVRGAIAIHRLTGLSSAGAAEATASDTTSTATLTLTATAGAAVIGAYNGGAGAVGTPFAWSGLTEDFDTTISGGPNGMTGASVIAAGGTLAITCTPTDATTDSCSVSASFK